MTGKIIAVIPTFEEAENIGCLIDEIRSLPIDVEVLVVDDSSPDGTGAIVEARAEKDGGVHLLTRVGRRGRGSAGVEGFRRALEMGADRVIEMDADFSHPTRYIPLLIEASEGFDLVIASRLVRGGGELNRSLPRMLITKGAGILVRTVLGFPVHDCTAGYRLFSRRVLEEIDIDTLSAEGPAIVTEILYRVVRGGYRIREIPYIFEDRRFGRSTLTAGILAESLLWVARLKRRQLTRDRAAFKRAWEHYRESPPPPASDPWCKG